MDSVLPRAGPGSPDADAHGLSWRSSSRNIGVPFFLALTADA